MAKTSASVANKLRGFIVSPLLLHPLIIMIPLETHPLDIRCARKVPGTSSMTLNKTGGPNIRPLGFDYFTTG
jgi:hypothetical protein